MGKGQVNLVRGSCVNHRQVLEWNQFSGEEFGSFSFVSVAINQIHPNMGLVDMVGMNLAGYQKAISKGPKPTVSARIIMQRGASSFTACWRADWISSCFDWIHMLYKNSTHPMNVFLL